MLQKTKENYFEAAKEPKIKLAGGIFAKNIREQFIRMLEYFGQSPIIVRSSSLLEDGFGNAFAVKYESIFSDINTQRVLCYRRLQKFLNKA